MKNLIPKKYKTKYSTEGDQQFGCTWWMWLGKCFRIKHYPL